MDKKPYIERMLEVENLTDELRDSEARLLLEWGVQQLNDLLEDVDDRKTAGERANALMAVMRKINRIAGSCTAKSPEALAEELRMLRKLFAEAFGQVPTAPDPDLYAIARELQQLSVPQVIDFLIRWYFQPGATPIPPNPG